MIWALLTKVLVFLVFIWFAWNARVAIFEDFYWIHSLMFPFSFFPSLICFFLKIFSWNNVDWCHVRWNKGQIVWLKEGDKIILPCSALVTRFTSTRFCIPLLFECFVVRVELRKRPQVHWHLKHAFPPSYINDYSSFCFMKGFTGLSSGGQLAIKCGFSTVTAWFCCRWKKARKRW